MQSFKKKKCLGSLLAVLSSRMNREEIYCLSKRGHHVSFCKGK